MLKTYRKVIDELTRAPSPQAMLYQLYRFCGCSGCSLAALLGVKRTTLYYALKEKDRKITAEFYKKISIAYVKQRAGLLERPAPLLRGRPPGAKNKPKKDKIIVDKGGII